MAYKESYAGRINRKLNKKLHVVEVAAGALAARMPCISCSGVGGQPGMETSTGITLETRPQEA